MQIYQRFKLNYFNIRSWIGRWYLWFSWTVAACLLVALLNKFSIFVFLMPAEEKQKRGMQRRGGRSGLIYPLQASLWIMQSLPTTTTTKKNLLRIVSQKMEMEFVIQSWKVKILSNPCMLQCSVLSFAHSISKKLSLSQVFCISTGNSICIQK